LRGTSALLTGRIFDSAGKRLSPTHTNKRGARYRYYVSHAVLQRKEQPNGSGARIPASEIEALVLSALRKRFGTESTQASTADDHDLIEQYLEGVVVGTHAITVRLRKIAAQDAPEFDPGNATENEAASERPIATVGTIAIPWIGPAPPAVRGVLHVPTHNTVIKPGRREAMLVAIAKARSWMNELADGRVGSFAEIARREGQAERHIRLLAPLAFLSPGIVSALLDGTAPANLTVTALARALPHSWAEQERRIGLPMEPTQAAAGNAVRCSSTDSNVSPEEARTAVLPV
jgi:site-specific DNA recombinase